MEHFEPSICLPVKIRVKKSPLEHSCEAQMIQRSAWYIEDTQKRFHPFILFRESVNNLHCHHATIQFSCDFPSCKYFGPSAAHTLNVWPLNRSCGLFTTFCQPFPASFCNIVPYIPYGPVTLEFISSYNPLGTYFCALYSGNFYLKLLYTLRSLENFYSLFKTRCHLLCEPFVSPIHSRLPFLYVPTKFWWWPYYSIHHDHLNCLHMCLLLLFIDPLRTRIKSY